MDQSNVESVCITHNGINVIFKSDYSNEVDDIKRLFGYYWSVSNSIETNNTWTVISRHIASVKEIIDIEHMEMKANLYRYSSIKKTICNQVHYYLHEIEHILCLSCFDFNEMTTYFYHEGVIQDMSYLRNMVREPFMIDYQEKGYVAMHASACRIKDKGIMMPGDKGAGKTSLLCYLLESGAKYIANDGVLCAKENNCIILQSLPQSLRVGKETAQHNRLILNYMNMIRNVTYINNKIDLLPDQLDCIFEKHHFAETSRLDLILIPSLDLSTEGYEFKVCESYDFSLLKEKLFLKCHKYCWSPFFEKSNDISLDENKFETIFKNFPKVYYIKYGAMNDEIKNRLWTDLYDIAKH